MKPIMRGIAAGLSVSFPLVSVLMRDVDFPHIESPAIVHFLPGPYGSSNSCGFPVELGGYTSSNSSPVFILAEACAAIDSATGKGVGFPGSPGVSSVGSERGSAERSPGHRSPIRGGARLP